MSATGIHLADTPTTITLDALGRPVRESQVLEDGTTVDTVLHYDLVGQTLQVDAETTDPTGTTTLKHRATVTRFDLLGRALFHQRGDAQSNADADPAADPLLATTGTWRTLPAIDDQPLLRWDSRGHAFRHSYDELRRPTTLAMPNATLEGHVLVHQLYGHAHPNPKPNFLLGQPYKTYDNAGRIVVDGYDVDANPTGTTRVFASLTDPTTTPPSRYAWVDGTTDPGTGPVWSSTTAMLDWTSAVTGDTTTEANLLESESFHEQWTYDALGRVHEHTLPDNQDGGGTGPSVIRALWDAGGRLTSVHLAHRGAAEAVVVAEVIYNARGQRTQFERGNGLLTTYTYDDETFRLTRLHTVRPQPATGSWSTQIQDLHYVHDPVGNVLSIEDQAFANFTGGEAPVSARRVFTHDALYRLVEATGREHDANGTNDLRHTEPGMATGISNPNDTTAWHPYQREYTYDGFGNLTQLVHKTPFGWTGEANWSRTQVTNTHNNGLVSHTQGGNDGAYASDAHGNHTAMPHLASMDYDAADRLARVIGTVGATTSARYVYDASGERVRKLQFDGAGLVADRKVVGGFELYRSYTAVGLNEERETVHVMDDTQRVLLVDKDTDATHVGLPAKWRHQLDDHLGSASWEVDENAALITYEEYFPYGSTAYWAGSSAAEVQRKRYRYIGKERDKESGFQYHSQRYYAPWLGRWNRPEPAGLVDGPNVWAYANGNPVGLADPTGTIGELLIWLFTSEAEAPTTEDAARAKQQQDQERGARLKAITDADPLRGLTNEQLAGKEPVEDRTYALANGREFTGKPWEVPNLSSGEALEGAIARALPLALAVENIGGPADKAIDAGVSGLRTARVGGDLLEELPGATRQIVRNADETLEAGLDAGVAASKASVWAMKPTVRGRAIEKDLGETVYGSWINTDDFTTARNAPLVDFWDGNNTLVSLKSVDTAGSTWMGRMQSHIKDPGTRGATVDGNPASMVLDLRVQPGGAADAASLIRYGQNYGVTVMVKEYP